MYFRKEMIKAHILVFMRIRGKLDTKNNSILGPKLYFSLVLNENMFFLFQSISTGEGSQNVEKILCKYV